MKKIIIFLAVMAVIGSCKKGENDPFISLKSRKARIAGEWVLSTSEIVTTSSGDVSTTKFNNGSVTIISAGGSSTGIGSGTLTIDKDGTYKSQTSYTITGTGYSSSYSETVEGTWQFMDGDKDEDIKNRERVLIHITQRTVISGGKSDVYTYSGTTGGSIEIFMIDQLKSKEMIINYDESYTHDGYISSTKGTSTYIIE